MLRLSTFFAVSFLLLSTFSALQIRSSFECRLCRELTRAVLPQLKLIEEGSRPENIPQPIWNALRESLPSINSDPQCSRTCSRGPMPFAVEFLVNNNNVTCSLCQQLMKTGKSSVSGGEASRPTFLKLCIGDHFQEYFVANLKTSCEHLGLLESYCEMIVDENGRDMYVLDKANVDPLAGCTKIKLC
ncbi:hypothetical protein QR680_014860 [Steinernema hermaphroditum]|uniref:Saposin B-type domain-containing protein n=1 Tax=Steinernema hermaphroditum TaxID=289476 RepID=A0AA39IBY3_9BILA|nr:hypothetical protein QR680_014860 [Steinernema hermaphroditum]